MIKGQAGRHRSTRRIRFATDASRKQFLVGYRRDWIMQQARSQFAAFLLPSLRPDARMLLAPVRSDRVGFE
jgi:hypothetical protein